MSFLVFLYQRGIINHDLFDLISEKTGDVDMYICDLLISIGDLSEDEIIKLKAEYFNLSYTDLKNFSIIENMDYSNLEDNFVIPFNISSDGIAHIAIDDPNNLESKDKINYFLSLNENTKNLKPKYYVAKKNDIKNKFQEINQSDKSPINKLIFDAIKSKASDIHITPFEKTFKIMFRVDGVLQIYKIFHIDEFDKLTISLKVNAKLDISENRRPQSGHFQDNNIDFRISTHPTRYGENIVIRILDKDKSLISIENIGFSKNEIDYLLQISNFSNGMIIFCGPTGSGKTTSIYSLIEKMDKKSKNIMTLEDPVEYRISNVKQTEIKKEIINFADGVKSILRQDPDIILIGEIRDEETAKMAIRASMTGHLVLTTIHANDSFGAIARFREFNIPNSLIADNVLSIISQRLVKKFEQSGRTIVCEILKIDQKLNEMIYNGVNKHDLKNYSINKLGFKSIYDDCLNKINNKIISECDVRNILGINL